MKMSIDEAIRKIREHALKYQREMTRDLKLEEALGMAVESMEDDRIRRSYAISKREGGMAYKSC